MRHFCQGQSSTRLPQTQICLSSQLLGCSWSLIAQGASEAAGSTGGFTSACLLLYCSSVILQVRDCFSHNGDAVPVFSWALIGRSPSVTSCISKPHKSVVCCFRTVTHRPTYMLAYFAKKVIFKRDDLAFQLHTTLVSYLLSSSIFSLFHVQQAFGKIVFCICRHWLCSDFPGCLRCCRHTNSTGNAPGRCSFLRISAFPNQLVLAEDPIWKKGRRIFYQLGLQLAKDQAAAKHFCPP